MHLWSNTNLDFRLYLIVRGHEENVNTKKNESKLNKQIQSTFEMLISFTYFYSMRQAWLFYDPKSR